MEINADAPETIDTRIAARLKALRTERGWTLDALAERAGVSRATLSRLENAEVSATASVLGQLCAAYGFTLSRLMQSSEEDFAPVVVHGAQPVWTDPQSDFRRRVVSPPARGLTGEVLECEIGAGQRIAYDAPPRHGLEHHLLLQDGRLTVTVSGQGHALMPGDCLRYVLTGPSAFETPADTGARYLLFMV